MNGPLSAAGSITILGAAIHGGAGEVFVVRKLSPAMLPPTRFGGPGTTRTMIHTSWHLTTVAFLTVGFALLLSGSVLDGDTARGIALVAAGASTGFAAVTLGVGAAVHGVAGEVLVVRKLAPAMLPPSPFGGPRATKTMIHATWHMTTVAFLTVGSALLVAGSVLDGDFGSSSSGAATDAMHKVDLAGDIFDFGQWTRFLLRSGRLGFELSMRG